MLKHEGENRSQMEFFCIDEFVPKKHLYGIPSLRRTVEEINMNVAYRWFLGYTMSEKIPHFATISYNFKHRFTEQTIDPECGVFYKGDHKKQFAYEVHTACDKNGYILDVEVTPGNCRFLVALAVKSQRHPLYRAFSVVIV